MSDKISDMTGANRSMEELLSHVESLQKNKETLPSGGSGGGGNMDHRIQRLEDDVKDIKGDLTNIKVTLATISTKLDSKVDHKWLTFYALGIIAVILRYEIAEIFK